ncbi:Uncharacterised protein g3751 [Pycnogonum litorale]
MISHLKLITLLCVVVLVLSVEADDPTTCSGWRELFTDTMSEFTADKSSKDKEGYRQLMQIAIDEMKDQACANIPQLPAALKGV